MDQRSTYLLKILEKIGAPLMAAVLQTDLEIQAVPGKSRDAQTKDDAKHMAELLSKTVQTGIEIGNVFDLAELKEEESDAIRLSLTAIASQIVGEVYKNNKKIPVAAELKKLATAAGSILTFSENFKPGEENIQRLEKLDKTLFESDGIQIQLQLINALTPVVSAIHRFPFGLNEQKLLLDVASRLQSRAKNIRESAFSSAPEQAHNIIELGIMRALANIYSACHESETKRLMSLSIEDRGEASLEPVWNDFDIRAAMLEILSQKIVDQGTAFEEVEGSRSKQQVPQQQKEEELSGQEAAPPVPTVKKPAATPGNNPMSMFTKKKPDSKEPSPPAEPDAENEVPPEKKEPPVGQQPEQAPSQEKEEGKGSSGGNPMSFFKPGTKKDDDED